MVLYLEHLFRLADPTDQPELLEGNIPEIVINSRHLFVKFKSREHSNVFLNLSKFIILPQQLWFHHHQPKGRTTSFCYLQTP